MKNTNAQKKRKGSNNGRMVSRGTAGVYILALRYRVMRVSW